MDEEDSDETDDDDVNAEPTQAYHFDGAAAEEEEGEEEGAEPMDCDATVAYNIEGKTKWMILNFLVTCS